MSDKTTDKESVINLPGLAKPAIRALTSVGLIQLEQFSSLTEAEVLKLHGMGPKAMGVIRNALAEKGLTFKK